MNDRDKAVINKIIGYCDEIELTHQYFENNKELFFNKRDGFVYRNSITMPILQIGELSKNLSENFRKTYQDIPWREITGMRDIFAHHYGSLDYDIVWSTSKQDIPDLKDRFLMIIEALSDARY